VSQQAQQGALGGGGTAIICLIIFGLASFFAVVLPAGLPRLVVALGVTAYAWVHLGRIPSCLSGSCRKAILVVGTLWVLLLAVA
jgi:hypothetical protein